MCIRDRDRDRRHQPVGAESLQQTIYRLFERHPAADRPAVLFRRPRAHLHACLLYTSDAADERSSVDLGGRRII